MQRASWLLVCLPAILFVATPVAAQGTACPPGAPQPTAFYINGVFNSAKDAIKSAAALESKIRAYMASAPSSSSLLPSCVNVQSVYNRSHWFEDIEETAQLLDDEAFIQLLRAQRDSPGASATQRQQADNAIRILVEGRYTSNADLRNVIDNVLQPEINAQDGVVIIGHSEGALYANVAARVLELSNGPGKAKIVAIATPGLLVEGGGPHTTTHEDEVINVYLSALEGYVSLPYSPLPSNDSNSSDHLCHDTSVWKWFGLNVKCHFLESYLNGPSTGTTIISQIVSALRDGFAIELDSYTELDPVWWTSSERWIRCPQWQKRKAGERAGASQKSSSSKPSA